MFGKGSAEKVELAPHSRILNPGFKKLSKSKLTIQEPPTEDRLTLFFVM